MEVNGYHQLFGYNILQNILFCVQQTKIIHNFINSGLDQVEGE